MNLSANKPTTDLRYSAKLLSHWPASRRPQQQHMPQHHTYPPSKPPWSPIPPSGFPFRQSLPI
ncbi:hypothetical protein I7I53_09990 [Histoplasma capsulatum var. duboisii H88]|uniref:Uncharacterized protein n=1 Tax=Ajellomyces capsulatus (strain H88) TaxID=544711 RepID=A0A8A1LC39_AJEC8|nr:hypothetical protein I7I53_09990 [Histoplasma capsulatum var. duboisii H88]